MKKKRTFLPHMVLLLFISAIVFTSVGYCFYLLKLSSSYFDNESKNIAQLYSQQAIDTAQEKVNNAFSQVKDIAAEVASLPDLKKMDDFGRSKTEQFGLISLQFLKDGIPEYRYGEGVGFSEMQTVRDLVASGKFGNSEVYTDELVGLPCIAVFCPVYGSGAIDGVLAYYPVSGLFDIAGNLNPYTKYYCLAKPDGSIMESMAFDDMKDDVSHNIYTYLYHLTESKSEIDAIEQQIRNHVGGAFLLHIGGEKYIATGIPVKKLNGNCFILQLFEEKQLLQNEYALYDRALGASAFLAVFAVLALVFSVILSRSDQKKMLHEADIDPILGCNTYKKFVYDAKTLLEQNRFSRYAVLYFDVYKFHYLKDHLSPEETENTLKYISNICKQMTDTNETVGHVLDDSFVILMHYLDKTELGERIKLLGALTSHYSTTQKLGMDIRLSVGVYLIQGDQRQDIQKMLDCAKIALQANKKFVEDPYTVYDAAIASAYLQEAELEAKMSTALKNRDFKLFFQPKYSIANDSIESAEVLVRWYNPQTQTYIAPDSFIRVFEANGFVAELDHYVFEETCRFLNDFTVHGEKIVPLSVNVSRATAIKPDFLNFYIEKKKAYGIADGFITLEFTESFAAESYEMLENLLTMLKSNGFKCAVDDFGMGNSSLIAVKELPIDELKFDRALIRHSQNRSKDDALLKMLIDVSKELGMTVTQEGVETREDMDRMRSLGCDLIQGYYYAKPMHTVDFIDFLQDDTSLSGIRRFKTN